MGIYQNMKITDLHLKIIRAEICPYCKGDTKLADSTVVYKKSYGPIYLCQPCNAWVGCHKGTTKPLGRLADAELRYYKKEAHAAFDKLWRLTLMDRKQAYKWLSDELGIPPQYTHIGMFKIDTCKKVIDLSKRKYNEM
jgi:hypothetical protein